MAPIEDPAGEERDGGEVIEIQPEQEVESVKIAPSPQNVTPEEVEEHRRRGHIPYRSWCRWCIAGRGLGEQRGRHAGRRHNIAIVGVDYWYITEKGLIKREELEFPGGADENAFISNMRKDGKMLKCVLVRCHRTKCIFAHVIPFKGAPADEERAVAKLVVEDIAWLGHVRIILSRTTRKPC